MATPPPTSANVQEYSKPLQLKPKHPGNPHGGKQAKFRSLIYQATSRAEMLAIWEGIKEDAKNGCRYARKEFLDRLLGKPSQHVEIAAVDQLFNSEMQQQLILEMVHAPVDANPLCQTGEQRSLSGPATHSVPGAEVPPAVAGRNSTTPSR